MRFTLVCLNLIFFLPPFQAIAGGQRAGSSPRKFDEFKINYYEEGPDVEDAHLKRFARQLKREPRARGFVIAYTPRILDRRGSDYWAIVANCILTTKAQLFSKYGIREDRIVGIDGGVREELTVEFWLGDAASPRPTPKPEFQQKDIAQCCVIRARGDLYRYRRDRPIEFTADVVAGYCPQLKAFHWNISSGTIVSGEGTRMITVDPSKSSERLLRATVEAQGLATECINRDSAETIVGIAPYKLFEFEEKYSEAIESRADFLALQMEREPELRGYIIVYAGRRNTRAEAARRLNYVKEYLVNTRGVRADRLTLVSGGYRENLMFQFWLVPEGIPPPPTQSLG